MKLTKTKLITSKVMYTIIENEFYFSIEEIRLRFPYVKFPPDKIKTAIINGVSTNAIRAEDIEMMTEFDKKVVQLFKYKK